MILSKKTHFILSLHFGTFCLKSFQDFQNTCNIGGLILYVGKFQTLESEPSSGCRAAQPADQALIIIMSASVV